MDILPRQIRSHVELAGISWPFDFLRGAEEPDFIAEFDGMPPARQEFCPAWPRLAVDLDRLCL